MTEKRKLTKKELMFCNSYLQTFNGTQSAIKAGYSQKCAAEIAYENLRKPHIKNYIQLLTEEVLADVGVNPRRVLEEYAKIAFFNPKKIFDRNGHIKPVHKLDNDTAAVLASLEVSELTAGNDENKTVSTQTKKVKFVPKENALAALMKYLGLSAEKIDITSKGKELQGLTETKIVHATLKLD
jgi:phage terminase small subunit